MIKYFSEKRSDDMKKSLKEINRIYNSKYIKGEEVTLEELKVSYNHLFEKDNINLTDEEEKNLTMIFDINCIYEEKAKNNKLEIDKYNKSSREAMTSSFIYTFVFLGACKITQQIEFFVCLFFGITVFLVTIGMVDKIKEVIRYNKEIENTEYCEAYKLIYQLLKDSYSKKRAATEPESKEKDIDLIIKNTPIFENNFKSIEINNDLGKSRSRRLY